MNEDELLADRLDALARQAPVPGSDPHSDVRRGRTALRRRLALRAAGGVTAVVAVGALAVQLQVPGVTGSDTAPGTVLTPATQPATPALKCADLPPGQVVTAAMKDAVLVYRQTAADLLDPDHQHVDPAEIRRADNYQSSTGCDPETDEFLLEALGTKIGWTTGGALGMVQVEVASADMDDDLQVVSQRRGWTAYAGQLPEGATSARVARYAADGGGGAVVVEREDGLVVAVDAAGVFGNNAAPGAPAADDLPPVERLLELAASERLTLPAS